MIINSNLNRGNGLRRHFLEDFQRVRFKLGMRKVMEVEGGIKRWNQVKQFVEKGERREEGGGQNDSSSSCFSQRRRKGGKEEEEKEGRSRLHSLRR